MRFWIVNKGAVNFYYADENDESEGCELCLTENVVGKCKEDRFACTIKSDDELFRFCHKSNVVAKQARYVSKLTAKSFKSIYRATKKKRSDLSDIEQISYHNAKKMNASIGQKINKFIPEKDLYDSDNKIKFIEKSIRVNAKKIAREILNIRKTTEQIETEYNLIEVLDMEREFRIEDMTPIKAHQLIVSAFYLYEEDFIEKKIKVIIDITEENVLVDYGVAKSAIGQLFSNAIKYCKEVTELVITKRYVGEYIEIVFDMESLFFSNMEACTLALKSVRGRMVDDISGGGIGLFAVQNYMRLHGGYLNITSDESTKYHSRGKYYSKNSFVLGFVNHS